MGKTGRDHKQQRACDDESGGQVWREPPVHPPRAYIGGGSCCVKGLMPTCTAQEARKNGEKSPPWHTTYARKSFTGDRAAVAPLDLLAQIQDEAKPGAGNHTIGLIMPSTLHTSSTRHQDLPPGAEMLLYCGIADLDAEPHHAGSKAVLKHAIQTGIQSDMT